MITRTVSALAALTLIALLNACSKEGDSSSSSSSTSSSSSSTSSSSSGALSSELNCDSDACSLFVNSLVEERAVLLSYVQHTDDTGSYYYDGLLNNHVQWRVVDTREPDHELAIEFAFNANDPLEEVDESGWFGLAVSSENDRVDLSAFENGALSFDLRVIQKGANDDILDVKMECDYPCTSWDLWVNEPEEVNQWETYTFPIQRFIDTGLDITNVNNLLILKPIWGHQLGQYIYQIDNIVLHKSYSPAMIVEPPQPTEDLNLRLFTDTLADNVLYGTSDPDSLLITEQATGDVNYLDLTYVANTDSRHVLLYWEPWGPVDLSNYYHADVVFDIRVVDYANTTGEFSFNLICGWPCRAAPEYPLGRPDAGEWQEMRVPLKTLSLNGLHLDRVTNPFALYYSENGDAGFNYQLRNIRWEYEVSE